MKNKSRLLVLCFVALLLTAATIVIKISQFPSVTTPANGDLFLLASGATNKNIRYDNLKASIATNLVNSQIAALASIARSKIAVGFVDQIVINDGFGNLSTEATLGATRFPALTGDVTTPGSSLATTLANSAVTDAKVASGAAIAKSKISTSGTWSASDLPTLQSTADGGSSTIKLKSFIVLAFPHTCDGAGAIIQTNDNTSKIFGQAAFAGGGAASTNFVEYRLTVPEDIDTAVALKMERFKFRLGAADTAAQSYVLTMASVADSASFDSPTLTNSVTLSFAGDASGASGDVETISSVTLTNWAGTLTAGRFWVIRLARNGDTDASTQTSYSGPLVLSYGSTQ